MKINSLLETTKKLWLLFFKNNILATSQATQKKTYTMKGENANVQNKN